MTNDKFALTDFFSVYSVTSVVNSVFDSGDCADAEAEVPDARVGDFLLQFAEDALLLKSELLHDGRIADRDFQYAALEPAGPRIASQRVARGGLPSGGEIGVGLDAAVTAGRNQLRQHVGDFFRTPRIVPTPLAIAASSEFSCGVGRGSVNELLVS
jgi:hypothetical protein